ncbi:MAG TPA: pectate lyase, partial [Opitutaceae bacterium]|nr:pectate lyase [Opitutaceae bacterium]
MIFKHRIRLLGLFAAICGAVAIAQSHTVEVAEPLTYERLSALPADQQPVWKDYLDRSNRLLQADKDSFEKELKAAHINEPTLPPSAGNGNTGIHLNRPDAWYATPEAVQIAENILTYQMPNGGWSKNMDLTKHPRQPGELYGHDYHWSYLATFDNDATIDHLRFLAKSARVNNREEYRAAFLKGLGYVFAAQYPNGGWPQVFPLMGGYHDGITFNDNAMINVLELLREIVGKPNDY